MKILKPTRGLHLGDSFRELIDIWGENKYCEVEEIRDIKSNYPDETLWIESRPWINEIGDILLYDNPILDKIHRGLTWNKALFGNEVLNCENCYPWIFWPRHPKIYEKIRNEKIFSYDERNIESCFIGSRTNGYRNDKWSVSVEKFFMGQHGQYLMEHVEYLNFLKKNKFGLCIRGVGPKCLRDIELIGLGTVPIFTPGVSTNYYNKLEENVHYLYAETPEQVKQLIQDTSKEKWEFMSNNCLTWYEKNISPKGSFETTLEIINS